MAAIKPWGRSAIIGQTVGSLALGIGMRWRETVAQIAEIRPDPEWERRQYRRCVISQNGVRLLTDLGLTEKILMRELRPARRWKFVNNELESMREGDTYPGCAPSEAVYHTTEGKLLQVLRREFLRFGGFIAWGTQAHEVIPVGDDEGLWEMRRDYGTIHSLECIVAACRHKPVLDVLYGMDELDAIPMIQFDMSHGFCPNAPEPVLAMFKPDYDYVIALGRGFILHMFKPDLKSNLVSWRMTQSLNANLKEEMKRQEQQPIASAADAFHPALRRLMSTSEDIVHDVAKLPSRPCPLLPNARTARVTFIGDALYPVDAFELRGDRALASIEDAAAFCRRMYSQRFHRGFAPMDMREHEMDAITKRAQLLQRDAHDVESFLEAMRELPAEGGGGGDGSKIDAEGQSHGQPEQDGGSSSVPPLPKQTPDKAAA
jgi:hypothetical protein